MRATMLVPTLALAACIDYQPSVEVLPEDPVFNPYNPPTPTQTDSYEQVQKPMVDILWVIDNSGSMGDEQAAVATNFPLFFSYFQNSGLDYHIGVVSTDMANPDHSGKLIQANGVRWITPETPNPEETFASMSQLGTSGSADEQGVLAAYAAFELQTDWNAGFFRDEAAVHVITVSDEPDNSPSSPVTDNEFADYLNNLRFEPEAVTYNVIVMYPQFPDYATCSSIGGDYVEIYYQVGGVFWTLCNEDWTGALEMLGLETAGLKKEYFLTERPVEGTIEVSVEYLGYMIGFVEYDPVNLTGDWIYNTERNSVTFVAYVPEPDAVVHIDYDVLAAVEAE